MKSKFIVHLIHEKEMIVECGTLAGAKFELDEVMREKYGQDVKYTLLGAREYEDRD